MNQIKNCIFFLIYLLINPRLFLKGIRGLYLPVVVQYDGFRSYKINTIIDVGAAVGNVSKTLHYLFPRAKIYAFDPVEENCNAIRNKMLGQIVIEKVAISNKNGKALFYKNNYLPTSSLLSLESKYQSNFPLAEKIKVNVITLDSYFKNINVDDGIFLKIDTQGAELQVLQGGVKLLNKVSVIHIETTFDNYYLNQPLFGEIYDFLAKAGFLYKGSIPDGQFYPDFGLKLQENSVFINKRFLLK